jgi:hypothetical protein
MSLLKASFMCSKAYRQQVLEPTVQLTVSVGQPIHEGERLSAALALVNTAFSHCTIMIDDSIQWRTYAIGNPNADEAALLQAAIQAGDDYLARNTPLFAHYLTIPYRIVRWQDWHGTPEWQGAIERMAQTYATHPTLRQAIDTNVTTFLSRYEKKDLPQNYNRQHAEPLCTAYLIEECAIMKEFWPKLGCNYELYPSGRNEAMQAIHQLFIAPKLLLLPISLRFHRKNNKTQQENTLLATHCQEDT